MTETRGIVLCIMYITFSCCRYRGTLILIDRPDSVVSPRILKVLPLASRVINDVAIDGRLRYLFRIFHLAYTAQVAFGIRRPRPIVLASEQHVFQHRVFLKVLLVKMDNRAVLGVLFGDLEDLEPVGRNGQGEEIGKSSNADQWEDYQYNEYQNESFMPVYYRRR
ncbi:hypothetical protein FGU65_07690 [Methanoculleus sp. FWC-SCC1]|uniref:Uncharacterized protein n=1 Tax=Methanoculleus frigidifontis TaxID=2584085 RepID=A0ABT8MA13_9EURY|nr:hypothetical protein [Methanoculleus sp. FWC-SCC1]MDN7024767.1 hypothetical protein [Methanoculleus sp. FWC-SCC1]